MFWGREDVFANEEKREDISHSAIIDGMKKSAQNNGKRRSFVMSVNIQNGQSLILKD